MNLRRSISWGLVIVLLIVSAQFVWHETTRKKTDRGLVGEISETGGGATPDTSSDEKRPGVADGGRAPDKDTPDVAGIGATPSAAPDEEPAAEADTPGADDEAATPAPATLDDEAAEYVAGLAKPKPEPIPGERAGHFVGADQEIRFGPESDPAAEATTPGKTGAAVKDEETAGTPAEKDGDAASPTPDTAQAGTAGGRAPVVASGGLFKKADEDISELISDPGTAAARGGESAVASEEAPRKVGTRADDEPAPEARPASAAGGEAPEPHAHAANEAANDTAEPAAVTRRATAAGEAGAAASAGTPPARGAHQTTAPRGATTIRELLAGTVEVGDHDIFYVHAVTPEDRQGIWGIIQKAVTENFARGVRLTIEGRTDTYRIAVPLRADEMLADRSSSTLGLMIHRKSGETIIYNRELGRLTLDPDVTIYPGNELVIVGFKPEELIELFKHLAGTDGR